MESGVGHIICNASCDTCNHIWVGVVEVEYIDFGDKKEYKKPNNLQCPNCMCNTETFDVVIQNKEVQIPMFSSFKLGEKVSIDFYEAGGFVGYICGVTFKVGKVFYNIKIFPFESDTNYDNNKLYQILLDVDSYFIKSIENN